MEFKKDITQHLPDLVPNPCVVDITAIEVAGECHTLLHTHFNNYD